MVAHRASAGQLQARYRDSLAGCLRTFGKLSRSNRQRRSSAYWL